MSVFRKILTGAVALPMAIGLGAAAYAQQGAEPATKPDPDALAALNTMGEALRALNAFTVLADVTTEQVLENGQKLQSGGDLKIEAQRPGGFKISTNLTAMATATAGTVTRSRPGWPSAPPPP